MYIFTRSITIKDTANACCLVGILDGPTDHENLFCWKQHPLSSSSTYRWSQRFVLRLPAAEPLAPPVATLCPPLVPTAPTSALSLPVFHFAAPLIPIRYASLWTTFSISFPTRSALPFLPLFPAVRISPAELPAFQLRVSRALNTASKVCWTFLSFLFL